MASNKSASIKSSDTPKRPANEAFNFLPLSELEIYALST